MRGKQLDFRVLGLVVIFRVRKRGQGMLYVNKCPTSHTKQHVYVRDRIQLFGHLASSSRAVGRGRSEGSLG